jgi:probable F420-dependent oxidoreductase
VVAHRRNATDQLNQSPVSPKYTPPVTEHPFRFAVTAPVPAGDIRSWTDELRRIEDAGFDTIGVADHFTGGWTVEPFITLAAAAMATSTLRLQTSVLGVDYRHPVLVHRMAATLDQLSAGRVTIGLGAGWLKSDYAAAGLRLDPPGTRIDRLEEAIAVVKGLFAPTPLHHDGAHYRIDGLTGVPDAVQRPRPPLLLGGGSPRVLRLAGREADIVSVVASLRAGALGSHAMADLAAERVDEKVRWVAEGAAAAGRSPGDVTLSINHWLVRIVGSPAEAEAFTERVAATHDLDPDVVHQSPAVLVGTVEQLADVLVERRERFGFSHLQLDAGFPPKDLRSLLPLVAKLAGC